MIQLDYFGLFSEHMTSNNFLFVNDSSELFDLFAHRFVKICLLVWLKKILKFSFKKGLLLIIH